MKGALGTNISSLAYLEKPHKNSKKIQVINSVNAYWLSRTATNGDLTMLQRHRELYYLKKTLVITTKISNK